MGSRCRLSGRWPLRGPTAPRLTLPALVQRLAAILSEKQYASASSHDQCAARELVDEFAALRRSHVLMFRHLPESAWRQLGRVNEHPTSTRALAFIMVGHVRHHAEVLANRYGIEIPA